MSSRAFTTQINGIVISLFCSKLSTIMPAIRFARMPPTIVPTAVISLNSWYYS